MKIAFILSGFPALSETFILNQITGLIDLGHDVKICALINPGGEKVHSDVSAYRLMERVYYSGLPFNKINRVLKAIYLLLVNFPRAPLSILKSLNFFKYGRYALSLSLFYYLLPFLKAGNRYDIVHCHFGPNGIIGMMLKELGIKGRIITSFHGSDLGQVVGGKIRGVYRDLFERGDLLTANSNYTRKSLMAAGCPEYKIRQLPVGVNMDRFVYKPRKAPAQTGTKIGTVARLVEKKGVAYAIKAAAQVMQKRPDIEYRIVGDGPLRGELERLVADLGCHDKIHFLGWLDSDEVVRFMDELHIFMLSSITARNGDQEGQGLVLQEAQAAGLPVLATLQGGFPEGVIDGKTGFLVPERDADALAEKLEYLIDHPERWEEMGRAGREFVAKTFDIKMLNRRLEEIYKNALKPVIPAG
jgi:colanic acid/amylovoran biosynthesis glycosyltransferase